MPDVTITRQQSETRGRYAAKIAGVGAEAELTFGRPRPGVVDAFHTETPVELRGRGIATKLVERLVADARAEGFRIIPTCPFVAALFGEHPEWADLLAR